MDIVNYLNSKIKYDCDIFINKDVEVIFTKDVTSTKLTNHIIEIFKNDNIEYKMIEKKNTYFQIKIKFENNIYNIKFKKSKFI